VTIRKLKSVLEDVPEGASRKFVTATPGCKTKTGAFRKDPDELWAGALCASASAATTHASDGSAVRIRHTPKYL
jgi:hypothetical protein